MTTIDTRYYAVRDPLTGDMTFWFLNRQGRVMPWPTRPQAEYGPHLWSRLNRDPGPLDHLVPAGLRGEAKSTWVREWYRTVREPWLAAMHAEIDRDPETAMARFAAIGFRCCICGKALRDEESRLSAIGPECRKAFPEALLVVLRQGVSRIAGEVAR